MCLDTDFFPQLYLVPSYTWKGKACLASLCIVSLDFVIVNTRDVVFYDKKMLRI